MATFSDMKYALDEIARKNTRARQLTEAARKELIRVQSDLGSMLADYSGMSAEIDQVAIDNPADDAYLMLKNEKDKLVTDFQNLKTYVDALVIAFDGVSE